MKSLTGVKNIHMQGTLSQNLDEGLLFYVQKTGNFWSFYET